VRGAAEAKISVSGDAMDVEGAQPQDTNGVRVWTDEDEWSVSRSSSQSEMIPHLLVQVWKQVGDPILHIEVRIMLGVTG
jgi:hypothetical protein